MTEQTENSADVKQSSGGGIVAMLMWAAVIFVAVGAGFATPILIDRFSENSDSDSPAQEATAPEAPPALIEFGEVVVNLNETRLNRYLRLNISLLVDQEHEQLVTESLEKNKPLLKSWMLSYVADKGMDDIRGATGQNQLRREIQNHFNSVMFPDGIQRVKNVLFQEFNIQ